MSKTFTALQRAALAHPHSADSPPDSSCRHYDPSRGSTAILTCDIDAESVGAFGGPVWHASVYPPVRADAETLLEGVGEGVFFDEPGLSPDILHLRRRMTREEIELLGEREQ